MLVARMATHPTFKALYSANLKRMSDTTISIEVFSYLKMIVNVKVQDVTNFDIHTKP